MDYTRLRPMSIDAISRVRLDDLDIAERHDNQKRRDRSNRHDRQRG
jgi:hypothetical protein